jgi:hypothetical protein
MLGLELSHFQLDLVGFGVADVGRIGDDEIKWPVQVFEQIGLMELNAVFQLKPCRIGAGQL